ncbi:MAG: DUF5677 domain-containing protein [Anaeromyxobacteraceae bacterium]
MSSEATDWRAYWREVEPQLAAFAAGQRSPELHAALGDALGFFGFVAERIEGKASRHAPEQMKLAPLLTEALDLLRGIRSGYKAQLLASLALMARTAFELRCSVEYLGQSSDVPRLADMFVRFVYAERMKFSRALLTLTKDAAGPLTVEALEARRVQAARDEAEARKLAPEWFGADGKLRADHWTGPGRSIFDMARDADLEGDYRSLYASTSKFTHGSPLLRSMYVTEGGIGPLAIHSHCSLMATLGALHCLSLLRAWCELFAIAWPAKEYPGIRERIQKAATMISSSGKP